MKDTSIIFTITILLFTLGSCDIITPDRKADDVIMPLEVGNYWEYGIYEYNGSCIGSVENGVYEHVI